MQIEIEARTIVPRPRPEVFEAAAGSTAGLARYFKGYPPFIPAIVEATLEGGEPPRTGATRHVRMGDGSRIVERILALEAPALHRYDMLRLNPLQRLLCTNMVAEWRFEERGEGTQVTWAYTIHPRPRRGPLPRLVGFFLQKAMQRCLDTLASELASTPR